MRCRLPLPIAAVRLMATVASLGAAVAQDAGTGGFGPRARQPAARTPGAATDEPDPRVHVHLADLRRALAGGDLPACERTLVAMSHRRSLRLEAAAAVRGLLPLCETAPEPLLPALLETIADLVPYAATVAPQLKVEVPALVQKRVERTTAAVRNACWRGCSRIEDRLRLSPEDAPEDLARHLDDPSPHVRTLAAELLRQHGAGAEGALPVLAVLLQQGSSGRRQVLPEAPAPRLAVRPAGPRTLPPAPKQAVRTAAAQTILAIAPGDLAALSAHAYLLECGTPLERAAAAASVIHFGWRAVDVLPELVRAAAPGNPLAVRREAVTALCVIGKRDERVLAVLRTAAEDADAELTARARAGLRQLR